MMPFVTHIPIRFHEIDAAGIVFFARIFQYAHDAYEAWLRAIGFPIDVPIERRGYLLPLVHAEADFRDPLRPTQKGVSAELRPVAVGRTSYTIVTRLISPVGRLQATVKTVHVCVDPATGHARPLPEELRAAIASHLSVAPPDS